MTLGFNEINLEERNHKKIIFVTFKGKVDRTDYDLLLPKLETIIGKGGSVRIMFELHAFEGWTAGAIWKEHYQSMFDADTYITRRKRLQTDQPATGKQVQKATVQQAIPHDVKNRFQNSSRNRPRSKSIPDSNVSSFIDSRHDFHVSLLTVSGRLCNSLS